MRYAIDFYGCSQCHEPEFPIPDGFSVAWRESRTRITKRQVYEHTEFSLRGIMGNFSRNRLPRSWSRRYRAYVNGLGLRALLTASRHGAGGRRYDYTLTLKNDGKKQSGGLTAEDLTVSLVLPAGATVTKRRGPATKA
jgi:hypothetical protein